MFNECCPVKPQGAPMMIMALTREDLSLAPDSVEALNRAMDLVLPIGLETSGRAFVELTPEGLEIGYDEDGKPDYEGLIYRVMFDTYTVGIQAPVEMDADGLLDHDRVRRQLCASMLNSMCAKKIGNSVDAPVGQRAMYWRMRPEFGMSLQDTFGHVTYSIRARWALGPWSLRRSLAATL